MKKISIELKIHINYKHYKLHACQHATFTLHIKPRCLHVIHQLNRFYILMKLSTNIRCQKYH